MRETGFSIWLEFCSTQAEAARLLGITDRSVRRYKKGDRPVPAPVAKLMTLTALMWFRPEIVGDPFRVVKPWPDDPDEARDWLGDLREEEEWTNIVGEQLTDIRSPGPQNPSGPQVSDTRTNGLQNSSGLHKSDTRTIGPQYSDTRTTDPQNSRAASSLKSWFRWRRQTGDRTA
jgi:hypothetical protein